jgi:hypothetical protein
VSWESLTSHTFRDWVLEFAAGANVALWQILLQKSQIAGLQFPRQKTKQIEITDRYGVRLVTEVAGEFITV